MKIAHAITASLNIPKDPGTTSIPGTCHSQRRSPDHYQPGQKKPLPWGNQLSNSPNRIREVLLTLLLPQFPGFITPLTRRLSPKPHPNEDILPEVPELALMRILDSLTNLRRKRLRSELVCRELVAALLDDGGDVVEHHIPT